MIKKILVVDDDKLIVEIYRRTLEARGYEVFCAYNGREGIEALRANPVDLVVLDLKMPVMSGDKFLKVKKNDPLLKGTKVVVMSSILYRYKENLYEPNVLSKPAQSAQKEGVQSEMYEKPKPMLKPTILGLTPENEKEFEERLNKELLQKVACAIGEPALENTKISRVTVVREKTREIIAQYLGVEKEKVTWDKLLEKDLNVVLTSQKKLLSTLEKTFGIKFSFEQMEDIKTVHNLVAAIEYEVINRRLKPSEGNKVFYVYISIILIIVFLFLIFAVLVK